MTQELHHAIVIGAGPAGISISARLKEEGKNHIVFEQDTLFAAWKSKRWDGFKLNTPARMNLLYGQQLAGVNPEACLTGKETVNMWGKYVQQQRLPVREHMKVVSVEDVTGSSKPRLLSVTALNQITGTTQKFMTRNVISATGVYGSPKVPHILSEKMCPTVTQLTPETYTKPDQLPTGSVLVVGSGQTGVQIAEELALAGKKVYLATSKTAGCPRRFRGEDALVLMEEAGFFAQKKQDIKDPKELTATKPFVGPDHAISYKTLFEQGVTLLGHFQDVTDCGEFFHFEEDVQGNYEFSVTGYNKFLTALDAAYRAKHPNTPKGAPVPEPEWVEDDKDFLHYVENPYTYLHTQDHDVSTVIWATGWDHSYDWIKVKSVADAMDEDMTPESFITPHPGFFFAGTEWARTRSSSLVLGMREDAKFVTAKLQD